MGARLRMCAEAHGTKLHEAATKPDTDGEEDYERESRKQVLHSPIVGITERKLQRLCRRLRKSLYMLVLLTAHHGHLHPVHRDKRV